MNTEPENLRPLGQLVNFAELDPKAEILVACLDIETASLRQKATVLEVGFVIRKTNPFYEGTDEFDKEYLYYPSFTEQVIEGRDIQASTINFLRNTWGVEQLRKRLEKTEEYPVRLFAETAREALSACHEVWVNHPNFDVAILDNLLESMLGREEPSIFGFRKVFDIFTMRKAIGVFTIADKSKHRSVADAKWNMSVLQKIGQVKKILYHQWLEERQNDV